MDKYDIAIQQLQELPEFEFNQAVKCAWINPDRHKNGCLFLPISKITNPIEAGLKGLGCLTMVKAGGYETESDELTRQIKKDDRIPILSRHITKDNLYIFAEYQRLADTILGR